MGPQPGRVPGGPHCPDTHPRPGWVSGEAGASRSGPGRKKATGTMPRFEASVRLDVPQTGNLGCGLQRKSCTESPSLWFISQLCLSTEDTFNLLGPQSPHQGAQSGTHTGDCRALHNGQRWREDTGRGSPGLSITGRRCLSETGPTWKRASCFSVPIRLPDSFLFWKPLG